jgi:hypothetical protein
MARKNNTMTKFLEDIIDNSKDLVDDNAGPPSANRSVLNQSSEA